MEGSQLLEAVHALWGGDASPEGRAKLIIFNQCILGDVAACTCAHLEELVIHATWGWLPTGWPVMT